MVIWRRPCSSRLTRRPTSLPRIKHRRPSEDRTPPGSDANCHCRIEHEREEDKLRTRERERILRCATSQLFCVSFSSCYSVTTEATPSSLTPGGIAMIRDGRAIPRPHHTAIKSHQERSQGTKEKQENVRESCVRALDSRDYVHVLVTSPRTHSIRTEKQNLVYTTMQRASLIQHFLRTFSPRSCDRSALGVIRPIPVIVGVCPTSVQVGPAQR